MIESIIKRLLNEGKFAEQKAGFIQIEALFETMCRKRNELTYEAGTLLSGSESNQAFIDAVTLVKNILKETKSRNP